MTLIETLHRAVALHQNGQLDEAERLYRDVLRTDAAHPDACHLLGVLLGQRQQLEPAIELIRHAIAAQPNEPSFYNNLGNLLRSAGDRRSAIEAFEQALRLKPDYFEALNNLGNALTESHRHAKAINAYRRAITLNPRDSRLHSNLGAALLAADQTDAALAAHRTAVSLGDSEPLAWDAYGAALLRVNQSLAAVAAFERAVALAPTAAALQVHLAAALRDAGDFDRAADVCAAAIERDPQSAEAYNTLANILADQGDFAASLKASQQAIALRPDYAEAHANLGVCHVELRDLPAALQSFEKAIAIDSNFAEAHRNYGMALLTAEAFDRGFREYEWRWKSPAFRGHACNAPPASVPRWIGESIAGKTILLQAEQGLGDTIQFARYIPLVAARAAKVIVQCPPSLARLLKSIPGVDSILSMTDSVTAADVYCPLMSLPVALAGNGSIVIPSATPYLPVDSSTLSRWHDRLASFANCFKIGLVWSGNPSLRTDRRRSVRLAQLAPLFAAKPQAAFFSLQVGPAGAQAKEFPQLIDFTSELHDFAETAGLIAQLDRVIAVDTAVAHLAGALAKPTWVMIPRISDWRWGVDRANSLWYPSLRLFRQLSDDWTPVIDAITT